MTHVNPAEDPKVQSALQAFLASLKSLRENLDPMSELDLAVFTILVDFSKSPEVKVDVRDAAQVLGGLIGRLAASAYAPPEVLMSMCINAAKQAKEHYEDHRKMLDSIHPKN